MRKIKWWMIFLVITACCMGSVSCSESVERQIVEQMELGQKYLTELDYEKAIVAFEKAIEIDPKAFDAYAGLAQVYVEQKEFGKAADTLQRGQIVYADLEKTEHTENTNSAYEVLKNTAIDILKPLAEQAETEKDYEQALKLYEFLFLFDDSEKEEITARIQEKIEGIKISEEIQEQVSLMEDFSEEEMDKLIEQLDEQKVGKLIGDRDRIVFGDNGMGIGFYKSNNDEFFIYLGNYAEGIREGSGLWKKLGDTDYKAVGEWKNDLPNGHQIEYSYCSVTGDDPVEGLKSWEGTVINGIWDGDATIKWPGARNFYVSFKGGKYVVLRVNDEGRYVVYEGDRNRYSISNPDEIHKIKGF